MRHRLLAIKSVLQILIAALLVLGAVDLSAQDQMRYIENPSESPSSFPADVLDPYISFPGDFDLEGCEQDCRSKYGVDPYWRGGSSSEVWRLYAICIQDCNRAFWKDYDRRMKDLGTTETDD